VTIVPKLAAARPAIADDDDYDRADDFAKSIDVAYAANSIPTGTDNTAPARPARDR